MPSLRLLCSLLAFLLLSPSRAQDTVADIRVEPGRGLHPGPLIVTLSCATAGAWIQWTLDGSAPSPAGGQPSPVTVPLARSSVLRAVAYLPGGGVPPSSVDTHTYVLASAPLRWSGATLAPASAYPAAVWSSLHTLPVLAVALAPADFATVRDNGTGSIGESGDNEAYERPCSLEWILPDHPRFVGLNGFQAEAGLRPHSWVTTKRAFRVYFKRAYGQGSLEEPVFHSAPWRADTAVRSFEKLVLRSHSNDGWESNWGGDDDALYLRDQFASATLGDLGSPSPHATWAHLFVNGGYYGLYSPTERPDHDFHAAYEGGTGDDYLAFNHGGVINPEASTALRDQAWNPPDLSQPAAYAAFQTVLDVPQFIDFLLTAFYCNTHPWDWPVNGGTPQNFYGGNRNNPPFPVRHFIWDFEASLVWPAGVHPYFQTGSPYPNSVFLRTWFALRANPDFRQALADRAFAALAPGGALHRDRARARLDTLARHVQPALAAEAWQWGDPFGTWQARLDAALAQIDGNTASLLASLRAQGLYPAHNPPVISQGAVEVPGDRLGVAGPVQLTLANPNAPAGSVFYTLDGTDPRAPGGGTQAGALDAGDSLLVTVTPPARLRARVRDGANWSALRDLMVSPAQDWSHLRIGEIHYHPADLPVAGAIGVLAITGDAGGDLAGRARVRLDAAPPAMLRAGDTLVLTGTALPANQGRFTVARREADAVVLDQPLTDEPASPATAEFLLDGDRAEFLELHNDGPVELDLTGVRFLDGLDFAFPPNTRLGPGARAVLAPEPWDFATRYGTTGIPFRVRGGLDNSGEELLIAHDPGNDLAVDSIGTDTNGLGRIVLAAPAPAGFASNDWVVVQMASNVVANGRFRLLAVQGDTLVIDGTPPTEAAGARVALLHAVARARYDNAAPWPVSADGLGFSLVPSGLGGGPNDPAAWRASAQPHGSPGQPDPAPAPRPALLVTEILAHTDWPLTDAVEIHNPTASPVDLAGWFLTDDRLTPRKWVLPSRLLPPGGYTVFHEDNDDNPLNNDNLPAEFFGGAFALGSDGDEIYLYSPDTGYSHGFSFGASATGISIGRHVTSQAREIFVAQATNTLGAANTTPRVGPVVITELHYHPAGTGLEFLELQNISDQPVPLFSGTNTWEISGLAFAFPPGVTLDPGEIALVVPGPATPADFAAAAGVPAGVRIWTCGGRLDNAGERIRLRRPDVPHATPIPWITQDEVDYLDHPPWPTTPDGAGPSLERMQIGAYGDDPANWRASAGAGGSPGIVLPPNTPLIGVAPAGFLLTTPAGTPLPTQGLQIFNAGTAALGYTLTADVPWLEVTPAFGSSASPAAPGAHTVTVSVQGLPPGLQVGVITVNAPGAANHPTYLFVQVEVTAPDTVAPTVLQARALDGTRVELVFSEPVRAGTDPGGAEAPASYSLQSVGPPSHAVLGADGRTLTLTFNQVPVGTSLLTLGDVRDPAGNSLAALSQVYIAYAADPVGAGLVAHWPLDEGSGATAADTSGGNHPASLLNGASLVAGGRAGGAVALDGVNDRLDAGGWSVSGSGLTLALWFRADDFDVSDCRLISKATGTAEADHFWMLGTVLDGGTRLRARLKTTGGTSTLIAGAGDVQPGVWIHAALVYNGTALSLYQDGVEVGSLAKTGALAVDNTVPVYVGDNVPAGSRPFDGLLDDVRVYNRALTAREIATLVSGAAVDADGDGDGLPDSWEITHFGAVSHPDAAAAADPDGDGMDNAGEWTAGTHPRLAASRLRIAALHAGAGGTRVLHWPSSFGRVYDVEASTNLLSATWLPLAPHLPAVPPLNRWTNAPPGAANTYLYRVRVRQP